MLFWTMLTTTAHSFCGMYLGDQGQAFVNDASEVILVRQGEHTTMNLNNGWDGDATEFTMVLPVPVILQETDVRTISDSLFTVMNVYTAPRLVDYNCPNYGGGSGGGSVDTGYFTSTPTGSTTTTVSVVEQFLVGDYQIRILSAVDSSGLLSWLSTEGFAVSTEQTNLLQSYIDMGMYFMAVDVSLSDTSPGSLEPLQFEFDSPDFMLPIRLGTSNSSGKQKLVIHTITDMTEGNGRVEISNYDEVSFEDECMVRTDVWPDFTEWVQHNRDEATNAQPELTWITEYGWPSITCDPCPAAQPSQAELNDLGFEGTNLNAYTTRLYLTYDKLQATEDLMFNITSLQDSTQIRYIQYEYEQESSYPICGEDPPDYPGSCPTTTWSTWGNYTTSWGTTYTSSGGSGTYGGTGPILVDTGATTPLPTGPTGTPTGTTPTTPTGTTPTGTTPTTPTNTDTVTTPTTTPVPTMPTTTEPLDTAIFTPGNTAGDIAGEEGGSSCSTASPGSAGGLGVLAGLLLLSARRRRE